jgi:cyclophilin family peptidyl-prolyl cis-trans isomerase
MVNQKFFSSKVGMFRALKNFLVQFGLSGDPAVQSAFEHSAGGRGNLEDDPNWLPEGPPGREINGVKRFQKGYLAYAGAGKNSRGTQLIMAFEDNLYLGGGSPWEVPFGQLVGENSFESLGKLYTGYGEKVSQGKIRNRGLEYLMDFPQLSYITSCDVMSENNPWTYVHSTLPTQG